MNSIAVLLLDLTPATRLGEALQTILITSSYFKVSHCTELLDDWPPQQIRENFSRVVEQYTPDLIIIVLSQFILKESENLLREMSDKSKMLPIMAVFESSTSHDIMVLMLRNGSLDFIPSPLTVENVFPAVWRLISIP